MSRSLLQGISVALIFLFIGVASAAAVLAYLPEGGSPPAVFDDFKWSSTANGFWHVNPVGGSAAIEHSLLTLSGGSVELDRRLQTDPNETVVLAKVRGLHFHKFGVGLGAYHAGTLALEYDDDGVKCGRGTDYGWQVDIMKPWTTPPVNQWMYLKLAVTNPYPNPKDLQRVEKLGDVRKLKPVTMTCSMYDASGHLLASSTPKDPLPNAHYVALDEVYMRTWDRGNRYQVDWVYAGPPSGSPGFK